MDRGELAVGGRATGISIERDVRRCSQWRVRSAGGGLSGLLDYSHACSIAVIDARPLADEVIHWRWSMFDRAAALYPKRPDAAKAVSDA